METPVELWVFIQKGHLAADHLDEAHLETHFAEGQCQVGPLGHEAHECITPVLGTENNPDLGCVEQVVGALLLGHSEDAVVIVVLPTDDLPDGGVYGSPVQGRVCFQADPNNLEFEIVGLGLEFFQQFAPVVEEERVAGSGGQYAWSRIERGGTWN